MKWLNKFERLNENNKIVLFNVAGAFAVKGFALFITLYTLPSYIVFFNNNEVLGLWFTILSLLNWILNFDLGIGNGLRNHLSTSIALNNNDDTKRYISSAYFSIGLIVFFVSCVFPFLIYNVDLNKVFNIENSILSPGALFIAVIIVFVGIMLQFWLKLINSILYALQISSVNNFLVLCTNVIILLYAKFAPSHDNDNNIIVMAIVHSVAIIIPLIIATCWVFSKKLKFSFPNINYVSRDYIKKVIGLGGIFFFIQIAYMVIMGTNEYLITWTSSNTNVIDYQAYYKLFSLGSTMFALMLTPIWSVVTKAMIENNIAWIRSTYIRLLKLGVLFCICEFILIFCTKPIMQFWLGANCINTITPGLGILFAIFGSLMIIVSILSNIACGTGRLKTQSISFGIGAVLKIPLSFFFVGFIGSWIGVMVANIVCMGLYCIIEPFVLHKYFKKNNVI